MSEELVFIAQTRSAGGKGESLIMTIPKEIVNLMKLKDKEYVKCTIKKIDPAKL